MANETPTATVKPLFEQILEAQDEQNQSIATKFVDVLRSIQNLERIGGKHDYTYTIMEALKAFDGLASRRLQSAAQSKVDSSTLRVPFDTSSSARMN
jgi:hypothetical protein